MSRQEIDKLIIKMTKEMRKAAADLQFENAAEIRDQLTQLKKQLAKLGDG